MRPALPGSGGSSKEDWGGQPSCLARRAAPPKVVLQGSTLRPAAVQRGLVHSLASNPSLQGAAGTRETSWLQQGKEKLQGSFTCPRTNVQRQQQQQQWVVSGVAKMQLLEEAFDLAANGSQSGLALKTCCCYVCLQVWLNELLVRSNAKSQCQKENANVEQLSANRYS